MPPFPTGSLWCPFLDCGAVNLVVCFMGTDKTNINRSDIKKYHCHDPVTITANVKNKSIVPYSVDCIEHRFHFMIVCLIGLRDQPVPIIESVFSISVLLIKIP